MKENIPSWSALIGRLGLLGRLGLVARAAILLSVLLLILLVTAPIAYWLQQVDGLMATAAAMGVCLFAGWVALGAAEMWRGPELAMVRMLIGMLPRMGIPLGLCVAIYIRGGVLVEGGFAIYLVIYYLVMLALETWLSAPQTSSATES